MNGSKDPDRLSLVGDDVSLQFQLRGQTHNMATTHGELHLRLKPVGETLSDDVEFAIKAAGLSADMMPGPAAQVETTGTIEHGKYFLNLKGQEALETWRQAKGRVQLDLLKISRGEQNVDVTGSLALDDQRKISGQIDVSGKGLDDVFKSQGLSKLSGLQASNLKVPLIFTKGFLLLGPFKVAELPSLY